MRVRKTAWALFKIQMLKSAVNGLIAPLFAKK